MFVWCEDLVSGFFFLSGGSGVVIWFVICLVGWCKYFVVE